MTRLLIIDGNALLYRAFFALPDFSKGVGIPTHAVHGFIGMIHKAIQDYHPSHLVVCFDAPGPRLRNEYAPDYQNHRPKAPDTLVVQMKLARELCDAAGIVHLEKSGYEADDIQATLVAKFKEDFDHIYILTGDKDILQLVNDTVTVIMLKTGLSKVEQYTPAKVYEKFGVSPEHITDLKAIMGDASDGYKGVPGIGPKGAVELITKYGSIQHIVHEIANMPDGKIKTALTTYTDDALLCKTLAVLIPDVPIDIGLWACEFKGYNPELKNFMITYKLRTLYKRLFDEDFPA